MEHDCHACCVDTVMTLTLEDVNRLTGLGFRGFYRENEAGDLQIVNVAGHCVFLENGRCRVYDHRPEGCWLYPLVLDVDDDAAILHEFCPYRDEFTFGGDDEQRLRESIATEDAERRERLGAHESTNSQFSMFSS